MEKPIQEYTDGELMSVIRQAENTNVPGSHYQKAKNEWDIRNQQKIVQAIENQKGGIFLEVGGDMTHDGEISAGAGATVGISVAGNYTNKKGKISQGRNLRKTKSFFSMDNPFIYIIVAILILAISYFGFGIGKPSPIQSVSDSPCSINTIGQSSSTNTVNCGKGDYTKIITQHFCYNDIKDSFVSITQDKGSISLTLNYIPIQKSIEIYISGIKYDDFEIKDKSVTLSLSIDSTNSDEVLRQFCNHKYPNNKGAVVTYEKAN